MKNFTAMLGVCLLGALPSSAELFSAADGSFSLDMPAGWSEVENPPQRSVLSAQKGESRLDIKTVDCTTEKCLDRMINNDVAEVKSKQMTVVKNTYTEEEIKRVELATGEPFYYISFYTPKNDFSAGYFLINGKGYSVLGKNITYAETDLIFAAISPTARQQEDSPTTLQDEIGEIDLLHSYDTQAMPEVDVENLAEYSAVAATQETVPPATNKPQKPGLFERAKRKVADRWHQATFKTLVTPAFPPFIRELGHGYDVLMGLIALFVAGWCSAGIVRFFVRPKHVETAANPHSLYPIKIERRYGTPSLILRAKDNQGNVLTALSVRWDALFMFFGIVIMLAALTVLGVTSVCEQFKLVTASSFAFHTVYSAMSLMLPLGFVIFFCGIVWGQVAMTEITLFDNKGQKAAVILQKGYSFTDENYQIYFAKSKEIMLAQRKRFAWRRSWKLMSKDRIEFASITERSAKRATMRMLCGHLWGMLRADYDITGAMESRGVLENTHALFFKSVCNMDKPEAVQARDLLAISLLISIRDRDKWYPWFN